MSTAGQSDVQIVPTMTGFRSEVSREVDGTAKSAGNRFTSVFSSGIKGIGKFVGASLMTAGGLATGVAAIAIKGGIAKSLQIENATAKMTGLGTSTKDVKTVMDNALSAVKGTAFGLGDAANVASTAMASGIKPGQEMSKYLTLVADAAATAQVPLGEMGSIMGKVTNSGKVTNDVLNQFGDRGVGVLQMLAKHYGVTAEEMTKMVSKGKVDAETFNKVLNDNVGGAAKKSGDTTQGAFANMKSAMANFGIVLSGWFFPLVKKVFNQVQFIFEGLTKRLKPVGEAFATVFQAKAGPIVENFSKNVLAWLDRTVANVVSFVAGFKAGMSNLDTSGTLTGIQRFGQIVGNIFKELRGGILAFGNAWKYNDGDITSSGFPGFMERAAYALHQVVDAAKALDFSSYENFTASLGKSGGLVSNSMGSIGESFKTLAPAFKEFGAQLPKIGTALAKVGAVTLTALTAGLSFLADHVDTIIKWMPAIVAGFVAWRVASSGLANAQLAVRASQAAMTPLVTLNNILGIIRIRQEQQLAIATGATTRATLANVAAENAGVLTRARAIAGMAAQKAAQVAIAVASKAWAAAQWIVNAAMSANPIGLIIIAVAALIAIIILLVKNWDAVVGFLRTVWEGFVTWIRSFMGGYIDFWIAAWQKIIMVVQIVWNNIKTYIQTAWQVIVTVVTTYINIVLTIISTVWQVIQTVFTTAWNIIKTIVATALSIVIAIFTGKFGEIGGFIVSAWQKITGYFSGAFSAISSIVSGAWSKLTGIFSGAINRVALLLLLGWNNIRNTVSNTWNNIVGWISGIPNRIVGVLNGVAQLHLKMAIWILNVKNAAINKFNELVTWVTGVPGRVVSALGNVGTLLVDAGRNIINGFLNGLKGGFESVKSFVGGIGAWIKANKGPEAYDKALLVPAGGWIMGGFNKSLQSEIPALKSTMNDVAGAVQAGLNIAGNATLSGTLATANGSRPNIQGPLVTVNPSAEMSETQLATKVVNQLMWKGSFA